MEIQSSDVTSTSSFQKLVDSQNDLFQDQVFHLEKIVDKQCELTGVNPLNQEMAAGAFLIKIGKRPRDLLNPKAIEYMQSVFSVKDAISKKECREISALFGGTATQVRDFFAGQRSRVRKFVKSSTVRSNGMIVVHGESPCADPSIPMDTVPLNSMCPTTSEGPSPLFAPDEIPPGTDDSEKLLLENVFSLMRKEETFSGQVELMEKIMQIQNSSVLYWFLNKGGVMILATWLSQAAVEEQTTVLHVILKVLCHLPLHKALPVHMSAILQSVNKLRFYRRSDISNRARILLSRWSKMFARSQAIRKVNAQKTSTDAHDEMLLKQSIGEILEDELRESKADISDVTCATSNETLENTRKFESPQPLKLLTDATDDPIKKLIRGLPSSQTRERRKVQLVEQPGQRTAGRNTLASRSVQATQGRPLSADDIQKAKMRARFMQIKNGKAVSSSYAFPHIKTEGPKARPSILVSPSKPHRPRSEEQKPDVKLLSKVHNNQKTTIVKKSLDPEEPSLKKWRRVQIPWQTPPETRLNEAWSVGSGQNSKEVDIQNNRIRREKETVYRTIHDIPLNPKEPWDCEMDYDDTLTPEIPTEQLPDNEGLETPVSSRENEDMAVPSSNPTITRSNNNTSTLPSTKTTSTSTSTNNGDNNMAEPDLELLAVLLKNPELVFALTSGEGGSLSSEETVRMLDMIKANGASLSGIGGKTQETVEVSLPSPTPSSDPPTVSNGWRQETAQNPFSRQIGKGSSENGPGRFTVSTPPSSRESIVTSMVPPPHFPQTSSKHLPERWVQSMPQTSSKHLTEKWVQPMPQTSAAHIPERRTPPITTSSNQRAQMSSSNIPANTNNFSHPSIRAQTMRAGNMVNTQTKPTNSYYSTPSLQTHAIVQPPHQHHLPPHNIPGHQLPSQSWTARPNHQQANQNGYNTFVGGSTQMRSAGPPQNGFMDGPGFESWSPDNSPTRTPNNYVGSQMNMNMNVNVNMNMGGKFNHSQERWRQDNGRNGYQRGHDRRR